MAFMLVEGDKAGEFHTQVRAWSDLHFGPEKRVLGLSYQI